MSKEEKFKLWLSQGITIKDEKLYDEVEKGKKEIIKNFTSITNFKRSFEKFDLTAILTENDNIDEIIKEIDSVYKYLPILRIISTQKKGKSYYRVFPNEDVNFFRRYGKSSYFTYSEQRLGRFNDETTKLLYVSTCFETAMNECGGRKNNKKFSVVEYVSAEDIKLTGIASENVFGTNNIWAFSFDKYLELLSYDSRYLSDSNKNKLYRVTNYYRKRFFEDECEQDGFILKSIRGTCSNPNCESLNISLKTESENILVPKSLHVVDTTAQLEEEYIITKNFDIISK